ncbi:hypothetical protein AB0E81_19395 [Streptomyces sp. NPDC033538]
MLGNSLSIDTEMRLIRMWHNQPTIYHGWTIIAAPSEEEQEE